MNRTRISVVGIACRYPDANSPDELWQNVLAGRRAFRRLPDERMRQEDYYSADPSAPDRFYSTKAAVIEGFEFDRVKYRVAGSTYRATDLTHWLALDTAAQALADAGFAEGNGLNRTGTGVVIGNSLTGEFSRAGIMRLRWPYVRRTVTAALREQGWDDAALAGFLEQLEISYKRPFAPIDEDSLAGGLANTIAGRVCNHFDFGGGGYTVDGACSSSLLSVITACNALMNGQLDTAIAGGVDLSIDPFEVIGFAKTGALATAEMRVYDKDSNGFWPGEGCGMVVLMREQDAIEQGLRSYATLPGWGFSSDGKGGITRPEAAGHRLALDRAYRQAGFGIETVGYLEGHGTGTAVGDATELRALSGALRDADPDREPAALSTLKGNIGHTKAAAGIGGLLKAILAVHHQVVPPSTSHYDPHPELLNGKPALQVPSTAELWPAERPIRAGVSSMGFGGINAHVVVERSATDRRTELDADVIGLVRSRQDCELFLLDAASIADLRGRAAQLSTLTAMLSYAELADLAATLQAELAQHPVRAAVIATSPEQAAERFAKLLTLLDAGARSVIDGDGIFLGSRGNPRIGFLFPGQGTGRRGDGGAIRRRFAEIDNLYRERELPTSGNLVDTAVAQPRIVTSSVAGLRLLASLGITAVGAAGHSLGEITALHWAGAMDEQTVLSVAATRGRIMSESSSNNGGMATIVAAADIVQPLLVSEPVVIGGYNSPTQTLISGPLDALDRVCEKAVAQGLQAMRIPVSHAFHSDLVAPAASVLHEALGQYQFQPVGRPVFSTVNATTLTPDTDLPELLARQVRNPVMFADAVSQLAGELDLLIEVGPGRVLRSLAGEIVPSVPVVSMETDSISLAGLLRTVAAAYVLGAPVRHQVLVEGRFSRPLSLDKDFRFFASPCESAPGDDFSAPMAVPADRVATQPVVTQPAGQDGGSAPAAIDVLRRLAAERAELPLESVGAGSHPLDELHLSSITVGQIVNQASRELGLAPPTVTSSYATSTLEQLAEMLADLDGSALAEDGQTSAAGVAPWVRPFAVRWVNTADPQQPVATSAKAEWSLFAAAEDELASRLQRALGAAGLGGGVLLSVPIQGDESQYPLMLQAARACLGAGATGHFVAIGGRRSASALAKTLRLEAPGVLTTVVSLPSSPLDADGIPELVQRLVADVGATQDFLEVRYGADGSRRTPLLEPVALTDTGRSLLGSIDVLLVTGGGKGITAECALSIAQRTGAAIALLGRSKPEQDAELEANLARMAAAGIRYGYRSADVTNAEDVAAAVGSLEQDLGKVSAVLHGAGRNEPTPLSNLTEQAFQATLAPKLAGLHAVLSAVDRDSLRLLVTFGSIIGRAGLRGEADYATANDWMTELTYEFAERFPQCKCLALEWSVWSGAGMGERLGVLESLVREGITPIPAEAGIALLHRVLDDPDVPTSLVVMGRAEGIPTVRLQQEQLPLLRFLDNVQVHYPGIELVADAELSAGADLYLADHLLDGDLLFPAVFGMEAMAQVAGSLTGQGRSPVLSDVEFLRPVVVPVEGATTIRTAALLGEDGDVQVAIRSNSTDFQADHFRATLRYSLSLPADEPVLPAAERSLPISPMEDLYGPVLFQGTRFQRLLGYQQLNATSCVADIGNTASDAWFVGFLPDELVLGDPGTRDAFMHAIQCCVPDATLLPAGIERLYLADAAAVRDTKQFVLHAIERSRYGDTYLYDLDIRDPAGVLVERWTGLRLQAVRKQDGTGPWLPGLLGPYLERQVQGVLPIKVRCAVEPDGPEPDGVASRRQQTRRALSWALGRPVSVSYRPDGKPFVEGPDRVSSAHGAGVTFAVSSLDGALSCDVESCRSRPAEDWVGLLGPQQDGLAKLVSTDTGEEISISATRVWTAVECLRKNGHASVEALVLAEPATDRWVVFRSGTARIATFCTRLLDQQDPVVFAILTESRD